MSACLRHVPPFPYPPNRLLARIGYTLSCSLRVSARIPSAVKAATATDMASSLLISLLLPRRRGGLVERAWLFLWRLVVPGDIEAEEANHEVGELAGAEAEPQA